MNIGDKVLFGGNQEGEIQGYRTSSKGKTILELVRTSGSRAGQPIEVPVDQVTPLGGQVRRQAHHSHPQTGRFQSQHPNRPAAPREDYPYEEYEEVYPRSNRARQGQQYQGQRWGSGAQRRDAYQRKGQGWNGQPSYSKARRSNPLTRPVHPLVNTLVLAAVVILLVYMASLTLP